jgi:hypothetical protein
MPIHYITPKTFNLIAMTFLKLLEKNAQRKCTQESPLRSQLLYCRDGAKAAAGGRIAKDLVPKNRWVS